jgi:hypothetical protein
VADNSPTAVWGPYTLPLDQAVVANKGFVPGDERGEDLLTVLASQSRFDWWAAADDLFTDLRWFGD